MGPAAPFSCSSDPIGLGEWQQREIQVGLSRQVSDKKAAQVFPVIPVLLPGLANDAVPIGRFLKLNTYVDLRAGLDDPEGLQRLVAGAQGKAIDDAAAEKLLAGLSPYRGLLPFREQDAGLFFGRKRFVDELVEKVRRRTPTNVVAVVGRSGSGKSSIVYAGLFPALRREQRSSASGRCGRLSTSAVRRTSSSTRGSLRPAEGRAGLAQCIARRSTRGRSFSEIAKSRWRNSSEIGCSATRAAPVSSSMSTSGRSFTP